MSKKDNKMSGVEHTYAKGEPTQHEKDLEAWRKEHVAEYNIDEDATETIHHEVKNAAGKVVEKTFTSNASKEAYRERETVNGIEISMAYDSGYDDYTIYFPQINLAVANKFGIYDQVIRVTRLGSEARKVFAKAKELAKDCRDAYDLYQKIEDFIHNEVKYENDED